MTTYYRILSNVSAKNGLIRRGQLCRLDMKPDVLDTLIEVGAISPVSAPELAILPEWEDRAKILKKHRITEMEDLFAAIEDRPATVAGWFGESEATVIHWKEELIRDWLVVGR
jgi:hypothetical protein